MKMTGEYKVENTSYNMVAHSEKEVSTKIHVSKLFPHFKKENNVRFFGEAGYDTHGMAVQLAEDGKIREEIHLSVRGTEIQDFLKCKTEEELLGLLTDCMGLKGYRRVHGAYALYQDPTKTEYPREFEFDEYLPVRAYFGMTPEEELVYICDHSQNKTLSEYELGLVIAKQIAFGHDNSQKAICWNNKRLFDAASTAAKVQELDNKLAEVKTADPVEKLARQKDIVLDHYKGRFQRLQRIFTGPNREVLMDNFRRIVYNEKEPGVVVPRITQKQLVGIWDLKPEDFKVAWEGICAEHLKAPKKEEDYSWNKKTWDTRKASFAPSGILTDAFEGAVGGKKDSLNKLEAHLGRLVVFEAAISKVGWEKVEAALKAL